MTDPRIAAIAAPASMPSMTAAARIGVSPAMCGPAKMEVPVRKAPERQAEIIAELQLSPETGVSFSHTLEVSLDCTFCRRTWRTVTFTLGAPTAVCHPGSAEATQGAHPPYPGRLVDLDLRRADSGLVTAIYRLEYSVFPFEDRSFPGRQWTGYPSWARVGFDLTCPRCAAITVLATQNNLGRPREQTCRCGHRLYVEDREMPLIRWLDVETDQWIQRPERHPVTKET